MSLFMGFTGVRSTARAAEGTAPLRTRAWQVLLPSVNRGRRCCLLSRRQPIRPTSRAYVRVYCWPAVAFPGPIISPRNNGLNSERFSREVNVHSFKVIRTSTNANERYQDLCSPSINCASSNGVAGFIISYVLLFPFFSFSFYFVPSNYYIHSFRCNVLRNFNRDICNLRLTMVILKLRYLEDEIGNLNQY